MRFENFFHCITGHSPFPWQIRLYEKFAAGEFPSSANIPTGLGKTSVVVIWAIALALNPEKVPRRLVYVVNRRTVVDQTTTEVENMRAALAQKTELKEIENKLRALCAMPLPRPTDSPLAISTLRGQYADNREWSADPVRPAVIIGTVDMIGSGLLFSRYTVGFKLRPHHAAFLAQDALLVHDEAHLEPAFQQLLDSIVAEQHRCNDSRKLKVMELTATTRIKPSNEAFCISDADSSNEFVSGRLNAVKKLSLTVLAEKEVDSKIAELALAYKESGRAILVFVRLVEDATKVAEAIEKEVGTDRVLTLTGTMRGKERDELVLHPLFQRFLPVKDDQKIAEGTVFLVATSAGEVGVNISADDLVCDLSTFESMAQRFGRVNRFGERDDSAITVVCPTDFPHTKKIQEAEKAVAKKEKKAERKLQEALDKAAYDVAREKTMNLLIQLDGNASPVSLESLPHHDRLAAFSPPPKMRQATNIQFDAWALTSIRKPIAARPPVAPYLHGEAEWQPPETHIAWREELDIIHGDLLTTYPPEDLLEEFPLKPHELLRDTSKRIAETLSKIIENYLQSQQDENDLRPAWLVREDGSIRILDLLPQVNLLNAYKKSDKIRHKKEKEEIKRHTEFMAMTIENATLILPASLGGISSQGLFSATAKKGDAITDVAGIENVRLRLRSSSPDISDELASKYRLIRAIDTAIDTDDGLEVNDRYWLWLEAKKNINGEKRTTLQPETLANHTGAVIANITAIADKLFPGNFGDDEPRWHLCLPFVAGKHDDGKNRLRWQQGIGNTRYDPNDLNTIYAKSGGAMRPRNLAEDYRHEFGSLSTISAEMKKTQGVGLLTDFTDLERDVILHLIAAHHGRARPHFPENEIFDYSVATDDLVDLATEVPRRFARLQQRFGRWGLAWLESILRSADYAASAGIVADQVDETTGLQPESPKIKLDTVAAPRDTISLRVDVANPGHYFACCGLFELAACLTPTVQGHFGQDEKQQWWFTLTSESDCRKDFTLESVLALFSGAELTVLGFQTNDEEDDDIDTNDDGATDDAADKKAPPLKLGLPFNLPLDWWDTSTKETSALKVWAGSMDCLRIARAMKDATGKIISESKRTDGKLSLLFDNRVVYEQKKSKPQKVEPFCFDAKRGPNADARDVGFSPNTLKLESDAAPAVEILALIGLQRAIPVPAKQPRQFIYHVWTKPMPLELLAAAINGQLSDSSVNAYRFESWFRTSQKKHKAFLAAWPVVRG